jgi:hypothetical protein
VNTPREEARRKLDEKIYPEMMALVQHHPEDAPLIEAILTKLRVIGAALAGEELDEDDRRELNEDLPE